MIVYRVEDVERELEMRNEEYASECDEWKLK